MHDASFQQLPLRFGAERTVGFAELLSVRVSRRARRLSVRVFHDGRVEVVAPPRATARAIEQFVSGHRAWIERKRLKSLEERPPEVFPPSHIELSASKENLQVIVRSDENLPELKARLRLTVLAHARLFLPSQLVSCAQQMGVRYERTVVRTQRTRWGSCSRRGTVSLNACLMFQEPEVVHYLLVHELAHLTHMNHSQRFWQYVERHVPNYRALDRQLRDGWRRVPHWFGKGIAS